MFTGDGISDKNITTHDPTEFYFTEFIPAPYDILSTSVTAKSLMLLNTNGYSFLTVEFA